MEKMSIWDKVKQPPKTALKAIEAGRLKGKSDINPQWRYQVMTETFGSCGIGWKYTIDKLWTEQGPDKQIFAFAEINIYIKWQGEWADPIPATGGSMLVEQERTGLHANDEAYKMAVTDALGTAMKMLGVAADVYMGKWDGSKYKDAPPPPPPPTKADPPKTDTTKSSKDMTDQEMQRGIADMLNDQYGYGWDKELARLTTWEEKGVAGKASPFELKTEKNPKTGKSQLSVTYIKVRDEYNKFKTAMEAANGNN